MLYYYRTYNAVLNDCLLVVVNEIAGMNYLLTQIFISELNFPLRKLIEQNMTNINVIYESYCNGCYIITFIAS